MVGRHFRSSILSFKSVEENITGLIIANDLYIVKLLFGFVYYYDNSDDIDEFFKKISYNSDRYFQRKDFYV